MAINDLSARTTNMTARTMAFSANPIVNAVSAIRQAQEDALTPAQRQMREAGERRTRDLLATGAFSLR